MMRSVFGLIIDARAGGGNDYPEGELHHFLVLVPAVNTDDAANQAMLALTDGRWINGHVKQVERFGAPLVSITDPVLREAAEKAFSGNRSVIAYDQA